MHGTVISNRILSHRLNPSQRMDAPYCMFLQSLEDHQRMAALQTFLRSKGLDWDPQAVLEGSCTLVPYPVVSYLKQVFEPLGDGNDPQATFIQWVNDPSPPWPSPSTFQTACVSFTSPWRASLTPTSSTSKRGYSASATT